MKQRVERIGEVYYPQYRRWFIWRTYQHAVGGTVCGIVYEYVKFPTKEQAERYCLDRQHKIYKIKQS